MAEEYTGSVVPLAAEYMGRVVPIQGASTDDAPQSTGSYLRSGLKSMASGFNRGVAGLAGAPVDTLLNAADLGKAAYGTAASAVGRPDLAPTINSDRSGIVGSSQNIARGMSKVTSVDPLSNSAIDRYAFASGAGAPSALVSPGNALSGLSRGVAGSLAGQVTADAGGNAGEQALAGMLASSAKELTSAGVKGVVRGGEEGRQTVKNNIASFNRVGAQPSVGQATESRPIQAIESMLARIPGGAGVMADRIQKQQTAIGAGADRMAGNLSPGASAEKTGAKIVSGVEESFMPSVRRVQKGLYDNLDQEIPGGTAVPVSNLKSTLKTIVGGIPGAPSLSGSKLLRNEVATDLLKAVEIDAPTGNLPYDAVKQIRTSIREKLDEFELAPDVPRQQLRKIYGSLTDDMRAAAKASGPKAEAAFTRANNYTVAMHNRIDKLQSVVDKAGGPEKVFQAAVSGTGEGATTLRAVMKSLPEDGKQALSASVIRRLGRATPGQQNDVGDAFSTQTFLTNWSKLSPEAKTVITGPHGAKFKGDVEALAKVAGNLREGSKVFANPSGTAGSNALIGMSVAAAAAAGSGRYLELAGLGGTVAGANLAARGLTNSKFVKSLSEITKIAPETITSQIANLSKGSPDDENR